jgi:hypothetical protein
VTKKFDFSRFNAVPYWPQCSFEECRFSDGTLREKFQRDPAAWNLLWALARKRRLPAGSGAIFEIEVFTPAQMILLLRLPRYRYNTYGSGNRWTLAAWMCFYSEGRFMERFGTALAEMLRLPKDEDHAH